MKSIKIGGKFESSAISLGCMRMSGLDEKRVDAIMDTALENGVSFFDHADIYGGGNAERVFGDYLKRHMGARDSLMIQTKCAIHDGQFDFSKEHMADYIQFSMRPMGECAENYKLLISSVEGVSTKHNSDELEKLISSERLRIRNLSLEKESVSENNISAFVPLAVIIISGIIAVMLFFFLRRDDSAETDENKKE